MPHFYYHFPVFHSAEDYPIRCSDGVQIEGQVEGMSTKSLNLGTTHQDRIRLTYIRPYGEVKLSIVIHLCVFTFAAEDYPIGFSDVVRFDSDAASRHGACVVSSLL